VAPRAVALRLKEVSPTFNRAVYVPGCVGAKLMLNVLLLPDGNVNGRKGTLLNANSESVEARKLMVASELPALRMPLLTVVLSARFVWGKVIVSLFETV